MGSFSGGSFKRGLWGSNLKQKADREREGGTPGMQKAFGDEDELLL
jgi:hypothetical protein